jgi:hypothetical protein
MKSMQQMMDKQYALLRLIIQKMEIISEADQYDEGTNSGHRCVDGTIS